MNTLPQSARRCFVVAAIALAAPAHAESGLSDTTLAQVRALAHAAAAALAPMAANIVVEPGLLDKRLRLAPCAQVAVHSMAGAPAWGRTRVGLRCTSGAARWAVSLPVTVKVLAPAWVARQALPSGTVIEPVHLMLTPVDWAAESSPPPPVNQEVAGRTLARPLTAGQALRHSDLRARQWFAAGDTVNIVALGKGFAVAGEGQALSSGIEGLPARVRTEGGRTVTGWPRGERRIEVSL